MLLAKDLLNYIKYTKHYELKFVRGPNKLKIMGYTDSDWAQDNDFHSISGYLFKLYKFSAAISWRSTKQKLYQEDAVSSRHDGMLYMQSH